MDLPANIDFPPNPDGFILDQSADVFTSVQAFLDGPKIVIELWGTTTLVAPSGRRFEGVELQQNAVVDLRSGSWDVGRSVSSDIGPTEFEHAGPKEQIPAVRRL